MSAVHCCWLTFAECQFHCVDIAFEHGSQDIRRPVAALSCEAAFGQDTAVPNSDNLKRYIDELHSDLIDQLREFTG